MGKMKNKFKKCLKKNKGFTLSILFIVLLLCYVTIPTLSEYKSESPTYTIVSWDGTVASSYSDGDGSLDNPYIISNGSELAYLALQLENENYEGKYFILKNDIVLNDGLFSYVDENKIKYTKDNEEYEIKPGVDNDIINVFEHLNKFKGNFDGDFHTIYGLYIDKTIDGQNGLFTNLEGNVSNLYIKNSMIYGGNIVGGVVSRATDSVLTNISYDGFVISDEEITNDVIKLELNSIEENLIDSEFVESFDVVGLKSIHGIITSINLSGFYQTDNSSAVLKINGEVISEGEFNLNLGNKILTDISIVYQTNTESNFSLNNLNYEINYNYSNAAGIISVAENTKLKNIINKANVNGVVYASGIVNSFVGNSTLMNAYNIGIIKSNNNSSGLISNINLDNENVSITNCYNAGILVANNNSMFGNIENNIGNITLTNVFNVQDNYVINNVDSSKIYINNSYVVFDKGVKNGLIEGKLIQTDLENLKNKKFIQTNLKFEEYEKSDNVVDNVWVWSFEEGTLPTLYIDDLNQPIANIYVNEYIWDDYKSQLETLKFSDELVFNIGEVNPLNPVKEVYYYISNEKEAFNKEQLDSIVDWVKYEGIVDLTEEGFYIVYAKIIDNNDNIIYLNTDLLVIDLTGSEITLASSFTDDIWNEFKTDLNNYYVNQEISISIQAEDSLSGINKIYYYLSDTVISSDDIEKVDEWVEYVEPILITDSKTIVYVKVLDNCNYITYANSDLIIMNGYVLKTISPGMNGVKNDNLYITEKSSVSLNFVYSDTNEYAEGSKHQLISNVLLPVNTKITLIDKEKNKVYVYTTTSDNYGYNSCPDDACEAIYDLELFNEVGSKNKFDENNYTGKINENFIVLVDFGNAEINNNIENIAISLKIDNENENEIRNTLLNSDKRFNVIYENSQASFTLSSTFDDTINYNENAQYIVDFSTKLNYKTILDNKIFDTTFEDKNIGLSIKMVNNEGKIVGKQDLKNIVFKIGDKKYSPSSNGIVKINLEKGINDITDNLIIQTYSDNYDLESGKYKFIITLYTAYDGMYSNEDLSSIEIPVYVGENIYNNDISFNVILDNDDKIVTTIENEFNFNILVSDVTENTNIRMSLYKKDSLSAYDQKYTIVDLGKYIINNNFGESAPNVYYALKDVNENNLLNVNLNTSLLEKKGYMFVFELYEGEKLVNKINKKFIVK